MIDRVPSTVFGPQEAGNASRFAVGIKLHAGFVTDVAEVN
jgi:hypothetical protein